MIEPPASKPPEKNGLLPNLQWLCFFMIGFAAFLFATKPAMNHVQLISRIALMVIGVAGLIFCWLRRRK